MSETDCLPPGPALVRRYLATYLTQILNQLELGIRLAGNHPDPDVIDALKRYIANATEAANALPADETTLAVEALLNILRRGVYGLFPGKDLKELHELTASQLALLAGRVKAEADRWLRTADENSKPSFYQRLMEGAANDTPNDKPTEADPRLLLARRYELASRARHIASCLKHPGLHQNGLPWPVLVAALKLCDALPMDNTIAEVRMALHLVATANRLPPNQQGTMRRALGEMEEPLKSLSAKLRDETDRQAVEMRVVDPVEAVREAVMEFASADDDQRSWRLPAKPPTPAESHKAVMLLREEFDRTRENGTPANDQYVTLDQAAATVNRSKRTLEKYKGKMPSPAIQGGGRGKADEWLWREVRPWLEKTFERTLPETLPSIRG